jgi:CYTH domain-containing protein
MEHHEQSYLVAGRKLELRVRTIERYDTGKRSSTVALKWGLSEGRRLEVEFVAGTAIARLLHRCSGATLHKTRHHLFERSLLWEIDLYHGSLEGLLTVELELEYELDLVLPGWLGSEVTGDDHYANRVLASRSDAGRGTRSHGRGR